ncbi:MAG: hypothetical protein F4114_18530 [Rhodospirillaceae bacterium]|nr:hypothetical protein [Rhodospirillaceae bacterium]MYI51067.1 hypothetical protein [Rhodospirillaceae bacterium]
MSIYQINDEGFEKIDRTTFSNEGVKERHDIQRLLKADIDVISPDTMIVSEEFNQWDDGRARIDLLGIDRDANIVVIELKRTIDGGYMELQAIRYAAMISVLTFDELVEKYQNYLAKNGIDLDARDSLLEFLELDDPDEVSFGQEVKIVLASLDFTKELTTSVLWLNERGLDIRCVRMHPYKFEGKLLVDVQTIIPVPEAADYQVRIREKRLEERELRKATRDRTKFDVAIGEEKHEALYKRGMMFHIIKGILSRGGAPEKVINCIPKRKLISFDERLNSTQVKERFMQEDRGGKVPRSSRYFCEENELHHAEEKTYVISNQWGNDTLEAAGNLVESFPELSIEFKPTT